MDTFVRPGRARVVAEDFPVFLARPPWWGGDLQTLRNFLRGRRASAVVTTGERVWLPMRDGSGDRLVGSLHHAAPIGAPKPLIVLLHGLGGCEDSVYMHGTAARLSELGFPVLRLNLRGAGPSRPFCRLQYHAGRTEDFADALDALPAALTSAGVVAIGFSLGANMLLKFLGERGSRAPLRAAVAVSTPLDLTATAQRMMRWRNGVYQRYLLWHMRRESLGEGAEVSAGERAAILSARSIWEFDDRFTAPRNGFGGVAEYYSRNASLRYLDTIAVPTLIIHALDDPWIPASTYLEYDWRGNANLVPLLSARGGHVGFQGRDRRAPWHDLCISRFLAAL